MVRRKIGAVIMTFTLVFLLVIGGLAQGKKVMTFMDVMNMKRVGSPAISPDGKRVLYTVSVLDWEKSKNFTDIFLVPITGGEARQMTFTEDKNENNLEWSMDGSFFAFLSDRDGENQVYFMRPDGGEAWKVTDAQDGVSGFAWNKDGSCLIYSAGKPENKQLWMMPGKGGEAEQLTKHETPISSWYWSPCGKKVYFTAPDKVDKDDQKRKKEKFDVLLVDPVTYPEHLWVTDIENKEEKRLTGGDNYTVQGIEISDDGSKIAFRGASTDRYASWLDVELYLLDVASGTTTRITHNGVGEGSISFSPDSKFLAFSASDDFTYGRLSKIYIMSSSGGPVTKLLPDFPYSAGVSFWSDDSKTIYFNTGVGVTRQLFSVSVDGGKAYQLTKEDASLYVSKDKDTGVLFITYTDPETPYDIYTSTINNIGNKNYWIRLSTANPQVENFALGEYETVQWKSTDGQMVEGIVVKPVNYREGRRYPLIVQIHGGPASAYTLSFSGSYGTYTNVFAGNGYAVFQPNYRGSTNYGEKFSMEIAGDYFRQAFDDIMTGVDYLIDRGIADSEKLGMMGWSAGGHWSNWTLVSTDRFKAISTGAGAVNWISLYAQTDVQFTREFYFEGTPYDNWDHYVAVSPLKYIKNAKTPTLIHFGEKDQRIPKPQGDELHMALQKLGVPTEYIVYPGMPHGLRKPRYQLVKMVSEFNWFEKWIKGKEGWFEWRELLKTLDSYNKKGESEK